MQAVHSCVGSNGLCNLGVTCRNLHYLFRQSPQDVKGLVEPQQAAISGLITARLCKDMQMTMDCMYLCMIRPDPYVQLQTERNGRHFLGSALNREQTEQTLPLDHCCGLKTAFTRHVQGMHKDRVGDAHNHHLSSRLPVRFGMLCAVFASLQDYSNVVCLSSWERCMR